MDYISACKCGAWHLKIWKRSEPEIKRTIPFKCRSWRHEGSCRLFKGAQDFARVQEAMGTRADWCHLNLTFEQPKGITPDKIYSISLSSWAKLRKRIERRFGEYKYIQTWEVHRSGIPHVHVAISNSELFKKCWGDPIADFHALLQLPAIESGFGPIGWLEGIHSKGQMAGYLGKIARELTGRGKDYQIPLNSPSHFRRIRASVKFLPPPHKNPDITGVLNFCTEEGEVI